MAPKGKAKAKAAPAPTAEEAAVAAQAASGQLMDLVNKDYLLKLRQAFNKITNKWPDITRASPLDTSDLQPYSDVISTMCHGRRIKRV